ncbi:MAG: phage tail protein [Methyloceanibacter sp.]|nr:phage tail protein [Methyloceanibacter sp.]
MRVDVTSDADQLAKKLRGPLRRQVPKIMNQAINRTAQQARTASVRSISKTMGLKQKDLRSALTLIRSNFTTLRAILVGRGRPLNLIRFGARQTRKGVSAKAYGHRRVYEGSFIAKGIVAARRGRARLPIKALFGPGVAKELKNQKPKVDKVIIERWPINLRQAFRRFTARRQ